IGEGRRQIEIVQDGENAAAITRKTAGDVQRFDLVADVQTRGRLVEEKILRLAVHDRFADLAHDARKMDALLLAARQFLIAPAGETIKIDPLKRMYGRHAARGGSHACAVLQADSHDFENG